MEIQVKKICVNCKHYGFKARAIPEGDFETWAFCKFWKTHFPNARGWVPAIAAKINARRKAEGKEPAVFKKPGERTCKQWES